MASVQGERLMSSVDARTLTEQDLTREKRKKTMFIVLSILFGLATIGGAGMIISSLSSRTSLLLFYSGFALSSLGAMSLTAALCSLYQDHIYLNLPVSTQSNINTLKKTAVVSRVN